MKIYIGGDRFSVFRFFFSVSEFRLFISVSQRFFFSGGIFHFFHLDTIKEALDGRVFALPNFPQISENFPILEGVRTCGGKFPRSNFPKLAETCNFCRILNGLPRSPEIVGVKSVEI